MTDTTPTPPVPTPPTPPVPPTSGGVFGWSIDNLKKAESLISEVDLPEENKEAITPNSPILLTPPMIPEPSLEEVVEDKWWIVEDDHPLDFARAEDVKFVETKKHVGEEVFRPEDINLDDTKTVVKSSEISKVPTSPKMNKPDILIKKEEKIIENKVEEKVKEEIIEVKEKVKLKENIKEIQKAEEKNKESSEITDIVDRFDDLFDNIHEAYDVLDLEEGKSFEILGSDNDTVRVEYKFIIFDFAEDVFEIRKKEIQVRTKEVKESKMKLSMEAGFLEIYLNDVLLFNDKTLVESPKRKMQVIDKMNKLNFLVEDKLKRLEKEKKAKEKENDERKQVMNSFRNF